MAEAAKSYPLIFQVTNEISCHDVFAEVVIRGRALMVAEDGEWWCNGVNLGAITEAGATPPEACVTFKIGLSQVISEFADNAKSFESFKRDIETFVHHVDVTEAKRWEDARAEIRR